MEANNLIAKAETTISAPIDKVWDALVNPDIIKKYMSGTNVISDWKEGSKIIWKGSGKGNHIKIKVKFFKSSRKLNYNISTCPFSGLADIP